MPRFIVSRGPLLIAAMSSLALSPVQAADTAQTSQAMTTRDWWPNVLDLSPLRQHDQGANPYGANSDYADEFKSLDLIAAEG